MDRQVIDKILDALKDGKSHTLDEVREKAGVKEPKTELIITFLEKYQFVEMNKRGNVRLTTPTKQFLDELDRTDPPAFYEEITA